jgi:hypothetical protein
VDEANELGWRSATIKSREWSSAPSAPHPKGALLCIAMDHSGENTGAQMTSDDFDDDEPPFASPEIQELYEAALGRFIVTFNQMDNLLTRVVETILTRLGRETLIDSRWNFSQKVFVLEMLKLSPEGHILRGVSTEDMRQIAGERNHLAHGFFDQNPYSGEYDIVSRKRAKYSAERVDDLTYKANAVWQQLRYPEAHYVFADDTPETL